MGYGRTFYTGVLKFGAKCATIIQNTSDCSKKETGAPRVDRTVDFR